MNLAFPNREETMAFGTALGNQLAPGDVVMLSGEMGAGKTTLTQSIATGYGCTEEASSPTFNLIQRYAGSRGPLLHLDLYRLDDAEEAWRLGWMEELVDAPAVIEWPDRLGELVPEDVLKIDMSVGTGEVRTLTVSATGPRSSAILAALEGQS